MTDPTSPDPAVPNPAAPDPSDPLLLALRALLGDDGVWTERADLTRYEHGWRYGEGRAWAVARPRTSDEVVEVVRLARAHGRRLHPVGANTGLVGASNPDMSGEQLVVSFERLDRIHDIDPVDRTALVDAGVTLSALNDALAAHGLFFPIDLGADPQIGGMVSTNTGGTKLCRYGDVRHNLLGLEVVLPDGTRFDRTKALRKDNTGLDFKQLFVGTSGRFGLVTRARLQLAPLPAQAVSALVGVTNGEVALKLLQHLERTAGECLSAFESISRGALDAVLAHGTEVRDPFAGTDADGLAFALLVELSTTLPAEVLELRALLERTLLGFCEDVADESEVVDVVFDGDGASFWSIRHQITECLRAEGPVLAFDVSVPRPQLAAFSGAVHELLATHWPTARLVEYGHWADGGSHLCVLWRDEDVPGSRAEVTAAVQTAVYDLCVRGFDGSYSAEHGVGPHNAVFHERYGAEAVRAVESALCRASARAQSSS